MCVLQVCIKCVSSVLQLFYGCGTTGLQVNLANVLGFLLLCYVGYQCVMSVTKKILAKKAKRFIVFYMQDLKRKYLTSHLLILGHVGYFGEVRHLSK